MKKEYTVLFFGLVLFVLAKTAFASIVISEIMYDPDGSDTNREWLELYNNGSSDVDISGWKLFEADTNHGLSSYSGGTSIASDGYVVITVDPATFLSEWSTSVPLFDSSFSLINSGGETLSIKNSSLSVVDTVTYDPTVGANNDGKSLQLVSGSWVAANATPGAINTNTSTTTPVTTDTSEDEINETTDQQTTTTDADGNVTTTETVKKETMWSVDITAPAYGTAGVPVTFNAMAYTNEGNEVHPGLFKWNMGDGSSYDQRDSGDLIHTYMYAGTYVVTLEYYRYGSFMSLPGEVFTRINFTVHPDSFEIKPARTVNGLLDVSINNKGSTEVIMDGWTLRGKIHTYTFPKWSIALGGNTITVTGYTSGFTENDTQTLSLVDPSGTVIASYPAVVLMPSQKKTSYASAVATTSTSKNQTIQNNQSDTDEKNIESYSSDHLSAEVSRAHTSISMWWVTAIALILLGMGSVLYIRREKKQHDDDDGFEVTVLE